MYGARAVTMRPDERGALYRSGGEKGSRFE